MDDLRAKIAQLKEVVDRQEAGWEAAHASLMKYRKQLNDLQFASVQINAQADRLSTAIYTQTVQTENASKATERYAKSLNTADTNLKSMFGSMMRFGIAMRLVHAAITINRNAADEWRDALEGIADRIPYLESIRTIAQDIGRAFNQVSIAALGMDFLPDVRVDRAAMREQDDRRAQRGESARASLENLQNVDDAERAKRFARIVQEQSSGANVVRQITRAMLEGMTEEDRQKIVRLPSGQRLTQEEVQQRRADELMARAQQGDRSAIESIAGITGLDDLANIDRDMRRERNQAALEARGKQIADAMSEIMKPAADAAPFVKQAYNEINEAMRTHGILSMEAFHAQNRYHAALVRERELKEQATRASDKLAEAQAEIARHQQEIASRNQQARERRNDRDAGLFAGMGGVDALQQAMLGGAMRGENITEIDARLRGQVEQRLLKSGVSAERASEVASMLVGQARQGVEDQAAQRQMVEGIFGPLATPEGQMRAALRGQFGGMGRMQSQMMLRMNPGLGRLLAQDAAMLNMEAPRERAADPAKRFEDAVEKFDAATERLRDLEVIL